MKKNLLAGLLVIPLAFGLSACSNDSTPVASEPYVAPQDYDTNPSDESGYLDAIRSVGNKVIGVGSDSQLLDMGNDACSALDNGETVASLALKIGPTQDTTEAEEAAYAIIAGAVIYLCPEYEYQSKNL